MQQNFEIIFGLFHRRHVKGFVRFFQEMLMALQQGISSPINAFIKADLRLQFKIFQALDI